MHQKLKNIFNYSQPNFYHFSEDSIHLAKFVANFINNCKKQNLKIADLGAGCGIVGLELIQNISKQASLTLVEVQKEFHIHLDSNIQSLPKTFDVVSIIQSIDQFSFLNLHMYDVVVSNPPYFQNGAGRTSKDSKRNLCRTLDGDGLDKWIQSFSRLLKTDGCCFFLAVPNLVKRPEFEDLKIVEVERLKRVSIFSIVKLKV